MSKKLSQLTAITTNTNADLLYIARGNNSYKITYQDFVAGLPLSASSLASVLAVGNTTNNIYIDSDDVTSHLGVLDGGVLEWTSDNGGYAQSWLYADTTSFGIATATSGISLHEGSIPLAWTEYIDLQTNAVTLHSNGILGKIYLEAKTINLPTAVTASTVPYIDASNNLVSSVVTPTELGYISGLTSNAQAQINALASGISSWKDNCFVATTANITLSGEQTLDGQLTSASRVLVWKQTNPVENGIYVSAAGAWTRATDFDNNTDKISSAATVVQKGATYADHEFICSSDAPVVVGTDAINFIDYYATYLGTTNRITVTGNVIDISATYIGQSSITTLGTIGTGTWNATAISVAKGGTGLTTEAAGSIIAYNTLDTATAITSTSGLKTLQNSAGTISWITTTGTGENVYSTAPTFVTSITTPLIYGGAAAGSSISYTSTTGTGTTTGAAHTFAGGTNGATNIATFYNDAQILLGTASATLIRNPGALGVVRVGQGTSWMDIGEMSAGRGSIWFGQATPSTSNYALGNNGTANTQLNATTSVFLSIGGSARFTLNATTLTLTTVNNVWTPALSTSTIPTAFLFTGAAHTGLTAGGECIDVNYNLNRTVQHASNTAITTQRSFVIQAPTHSFVSATGTITDAATLAITGAPLSGTNGAITNSHGLLIQAGAVTAGVTNGYGLTVNAPTTATNNYSAQFTGIVKFNTGVFNDGGGVKHARVTTGSVAAGTTTLVTITWTTAFADANYTVTADVLEATTSSLSMSVVHIESVTASAVTVRVLNNALGSLTGTVQVIAIHD